MSPLMNSQGEGQTIQASTVRTGIFCQCFDRFRPIWKSRSHTIRLLQDFEEKLFMMHPSEELRDEDDCLKELTEATRIKFGRGDYVV
jgi:hypothetical protein